MTAWWTWVQRQLDARDWRPVDLASKADINLSAVGRWRTAGQTPSVQTVRAVCDALQRPILEGLVNAGYLSPEEAAVDVIRVDLGGVSLDELLDEVRRRAQPDTTPEPSAEDAGVSAPGDGNGPAVGAGRRRPSRSV